MPMEADGHDPRHTAAWPGTEAQLRECRHTVPTKSGLGGCLRVQGHHRSAVAQLPSPLGPSVKTSSERSSPPAGNPILKMSLPAHKKTKSSLAFVIVQLLHTHTLMHAQSKAQDEGSCGRGPEPSHSPHRGAALLPQGSEVIWQQCSQSRIQPTPSSSLTTAINQGADVIGRLPSHWRVIP